MGGEWTKEPFPEVIDFQEGPGILAKDFREEGVPLVRLSGLERGTSVLAGCNFLDPGIVSRKWSHFFLAKGDVLLSTSASLGRIAIVDDEGIGAIPYTGIIRMRPRDHRVAQEFIRYLLEGPEFQHQAEIVGAGSVIQHFGPTHLRQMSVILPPLPEQRAIAHILGTLDDKIELNRKMNETLEAMARALFKSWFVDFDPVRAKAEGRGTGLPEDITDLFPDEFEDSELGEIPKGWKCVPFPEAIRVNPVRSLKKGEVAPYLDMANMPTHGHCPEKVVNKPFGSGMKFINGDTLVARITPCLENGKTAFVDFLEEGEVGWGSTEYIVLRPNPPLPEEFAYCLARTCEFREFAIQNMTGSSGRQRVSTDALWHFHLCFPPASLLGIFGRAIQHLFSRVSENARASRNLVAIRDTLLPKLISGELRVPEAEHLIEKEPFL